MFFGVILYYRQPLVGSDSYPSIPSSFRKISSRLLTDYSYVMFAKSSSCSSQLVRRPQITWKPLEVMSNSRRTEQTGTSTTVSNVAPKTNGKEGKKTKVSSVPQLVIQDRLMAVLSKHKDGLDLAQVEIEGQKLKAIPKGRYSGVARSEFTTKESKEAGGLSSFFQVCPSTASWSASSTLSGEIVSTGLSVCSRQKR